MLQCSWYTLYIQYILRYMQIPTINTDIQKKFTNLWEFLLSKNESSISFTMSMYLCLQRTSRKIGYQFLWQRNMLSISTIVAEDSPFSSSSRFTASKISLFTTLSEYKSTMISLGLSFLYKTSAKMSIRRICIVKTRVSIFSCLSKTLATYSKSETI